MLLNFQRQFARQVWQGEKRQTIRAAGHRKHVPQVGDLAYCYTGLRTRHTQHLGTWTITRVEVLRMDILPDTLESMVLGSNPLTANAFEALARADGFGNGSAMARWFIDNQPPGEFYGWVIEWAWSPTPGKVFELVSTEERLRILAIRTPKPARYSR